MAVYEIASGTNFTNFRLPSELNFGGGNTSAPVTVSDGNNLDNEFDTTEALTIDFTASGGPISNATFVGTVNIEGADYPVFHDIAADLYVVYGPTLPLATYPDFASLGPVTTSNLTVDFCFAMGTQIATPGGFALVEDLQIGDMITRADGGVVPVKWIGRQSKHKLLAGSRLQPVCIRAGALGDGLPHSDLTVTGDHGMVIDGLVINASALVNGETIAWVAMSELPDSVTYYHVETEDHDVILANGALAETFVDVAGRRDFDNYQQYLDLYGVERTILEMDRPRLSAQRLVPEAIKTRLGIVDDATEFTAKFSA